MRRAMAPAICRTAICTFDIVSITTSERSFSVLDLHLPSRARPDVRSDNCQTVPQFHHIARNQHFPDRMRDASFTEGKAFDAE